MKIAIAGCLHGELDRLYEQIDKLEKESKTSVDLVLICGDFQAVRNKNDLKCMHVPVKYQRLGTFWQYYFGVKKAPKLSIIIGGNHEASNYFQSLPYGGWIAPNMYYLGYASVIKFGGLRIGGISGIFGKYSNPRYRHDNLGHYESLPYDRDSMVSAYHMREAEVYKLLQLRRNPLGDFHPIVDIFLSHDWPLNIHNFGNVEYLINKKPWFREEIQRGCLGNPLLLPLLEHLKTEHWFAAHMHVGFNATVDHYRASNFYPEKKEGEEIRPSVTKFQALHKTGFYFVQIRDIPAPSDGSDEPKKLEFDLEWLTILKKTSQLMQVTRNIVPNCAPKRNSIEITDEELEETRQQMNNDLTIAENFAPSNPVPSQDEDLDPERCFNFLNPQTTDLCKKLGIPDPLQLLIDIHGSKGAANVKNVVPNPDEINLDESDEDDCNCDGSNKKSKTSDGDGLYFVDVTGEP